MGMLRKPGPSGRARDDSPPSESPLAKSYPALFAFLTEGTWDDDTPRETGTLMFMFEDGLVKAWLHDRDGVGRSCWLSGETLEDVLAACDDAAGGSRGEWRVDRAKAAAGRGRRS